MTRSTPHPVVIELDVKDTALRAHARLVTNRLVLIAAIQKLAFWQT